MGYAPVSMSVLTRWASALALGVALVAAGCAGSSGGGLADGDMASALPAALQKIHYKPGELQVEVTAERKSDGKTRTSSLKDLVIDNDAGTFSGKSFSLAAGDYLISLAFIYDEPGFGKVTIATIDNVDVTIVEGGPNDIDVSGKAMTFPNDDGDVFSNLEEAEAGTDPGTPGPNVAVLANTSFVDYNPDPAADIADGSADSEASNMQAGLEDMGAAVTPFTDISSGSLIAVGAANEVIVVPEMENGDVTPSLDAAAQQGIRDYVAAGGTMIVNAPNRSLNFLNTVFGFALVAGTGAPSNLIAAQAADTPFADGPASLTSQSLTTAFTTASLPPGSRSVYQDAGGTNTMVAEIPFGTGRIVLLGWDWFDAAPVGPEDGGWLAVLKSAVRTSLPTRVSLFIDTAFVDYIPGNSGSEASNVEATLRRTAEIPVTPFNSEVDSAEPAVAGKKVLIIPELEKSGDLPGSIDAISQGILSDFVKNGGTFVISLSNSNTEAEDLINLLFGTTVAQGTSDPATSLDTAAAAGTGFAGGPKDLPANDATRSLDETTLPAGALSIYNDGSGNATVALIPFGKGRVIVLGWDFYDAAPVGGQDSGWVDVLTRAVRSGL